MRGYMKKALAVIAFVIVSVMSILPASAHVGITPDTGEQGGFSTFAFKVPNEDANAATIKVEVQLPEEYPIGFVSIQPKPGWTYTVAKRTLDKPLELFGSKITEVVSTITWEGGTIKGGEFDEFKVSFGPLPETKSISFKALQTYDNGEVVRWIDETKEGEEEPEHPAPTLMLTKAADGESAHGATSMSKDSDAKADDKDDDDDDSNDIITYIALGIGALAIVISVFNKKKK